jgi:hypothetical protein
VFSKLVCQFLSQKRTKPETIFQFSYQRRIIIAKEYIHPISSDNAICAYSRLGQPFDSKGDTWVSVNIHTTRLIVSVSINEFSTAIDL